MNTKDQDCVVDSNNVSSSSQNLRKHGKVLGALHHQQQQQKKQVRRRLHTSRPYQERLLNMAEARKEIATALKFHRASMKQAVEQQQQQQQQEQQKLLVSLQPSHHPSFEQDGRLKYWRNPRIYPSSTTQFSNSFVDESDFSCSSFSYPLPSLPNYYTLPIVSQNVAPPSPPLVVANPNFSLPNQTLGLNLTFHDFNNLDPTLFPNNNNNSSCCSYSSPTSIEGVSSSVVDTIESSATTQVISGGLHATMDDEGMAEMRSLGEKYQMEWNDTMDLVTSTRWSNFLNNMEHDTAVTPQVKSAVEDDAYHHIFDELIEFPTWLNANDSCLELSSEDYFKNPSLLWFNNAVLE